MFSLAEEENNSLSIYIHMHANICKRIHDYSIAQRLVTGEYIGCVTILCRCNKLVETGTTLSYFALGNIIVRKRVWSSHYMYKEQTADERRKDATKARCEADILAASHAYNDARRDRDLMDYVNI